MESSLWIALLVGFPTLALLASWIVSASSNSGKNRNVPPGSTGLPFLGDTLRFIKALSTDSLHSLWEEKSAKFGSLFKMSVLGEQVVVMDPPAGVKFFFLNENKLFKNYPFARLLGSDSISVRFGEEHRICRRHIVANILGPETLCRFLPRLETRALENLELWKEGDEICSYKLVKRLTFGLICELTLSLTEPEDFDKALHAFEPWIAGLLQLPINLPGFKYHRALKARASLHRILDRRIEKRREDLKNGKAPQDWLTDMLTRPDEQGHMYTNNEIKDNVQFLLIAGFETSSSALTLAIRNIAKYPEIYEAILREQSEIFAKKGENDPLTPDDVSNMKYTWRVVQETMRTVPVVNMILRTATEDFEYNGFSIRKGWTILWSQDRCSKDEKFFKDPQKFDPARFERENPAPYTYLPFGSGPRACPGNEFAKFEILVFLHHFIKKFKWSIVNPNEAMVRRFVPMTQHGSLLTVSRRDAPFIE